MIRPQTRLAMMLVRALNRAQYARGNAQRELEEITTVVENLSIQLDNLPVSARQEAVFQLHQQEISRLQRKMNQVDRTMIRAE
jgi:predicted NUDIX family phosphoesterase